MYVSMYPSSDMRKFHSMEDVYYVVGIVVNNTIVKPPRCPICGEYIFIDFNTGYGQCSHCGEIRTLYFNEVLALSKKWEVL